MDPVTLTKWNVVVVTVCVTTSTALFFLRSYARLFIKRHWILEDYICLISWGGFVAYCGLMTTTVAKHGGTHEWDLTVGQVDDALYWFYVTSIVYGPVICCTKLAVLFLYRRVFVPRRGSGFDIFLLLTMVVLIFFYMAITLAKIFECTPRVRAWDKSYEGTCIEVGSLLAASGMFNTITDFAILLIPVKSVWALNMKRRQKWGVVMIFTLGSIAPIFSIIGFIVREQVSTNEDSTYTQPSILLWATAEITTGLICVCLPETGTLRSSRRRSRRPTCNAAAGNGHDVRNNALETNNRKSKASYSRDPQLLNQSYVELSETHTQHNHGSEMPRQIHFPLGKGRPQSSLGNEDGYHAHVSLASGLDSDSIFDETSKGNIMKTVRIELSSG